MLWAQPRFLQAMLEVSLPALGVSDLALEHVYYLLVVPGHYSDQVFPNSSYLFEHNNG